MPSSLTFVVPRTPQAPARARARVAEFLADVPEERRMDVELAVSELVSNAVRHGNGTPTVKLERSRDGLRLEVVDDGDAPGEVRRKPPGESGGWGLRLLDSISTRWGAYEGTTHVWCEIPLG
jgi:anti-sigma regulatory factor (Ser/Thr protein kinase)